MIKYSNNIAGDNVIRYIPNGFISLTWRKMKRILFLNITSRFTIIFMRPILIAYVFIDRNISESYKIIQGQLNQQSNQQISNIEISWYIPTTSRSKLKIWYVTRTAGAAADAAEKLKRQT